MPAPDPEGVWYEVEPGTIRVFACRLWLTNPGNRDARAMSIAENLHRNGWRCEWCGDSIPAFRRSDARYCREGCRKRAARLSRSVRGG